MMQNLSPMRTMPARGTQRVLLKIGSLLLMLPQEEVGSIESSRDVLDQTSQPTPNAGVGWIQFAGQAWPVYAFSQSFESLQIAPASCRACVLLILGNTYLGILCDDAQVLKTQAQDVFALPDAMYLPQSPVTGLLQYEGQFACLSNSARLSTLLLAAPPLPALAGLGVNHA